MAFLFLLLLQAVPQTDRELVAPSVGGEIVGPYIFREDVGQTTKVILKSNGLTIILREQNAVPLTSITTHVKVGYFDEPDALSGISHVIEHMFFKGTETRQLGRIARETKALGGSLNAYTHYDRTVYHVVVPSGNAVAAMEIQADALWNPAFDPDELAREIEVVLEENNRKLDSPPALVQERLYATAFTGHPVRRWRIGTPEGLRALTREDLVGYYEKYYQPSNVILSVVGQFDREDMLGEIMRLYGDVEDTAVERDSPPAEPPQTGFRYSWDIGPLEQAQVAMGFHVPDVLSDDSFTLDVLSAVLTSGRASRLNQFLRDEEGLLTDASSSYLGFKGLGYFQLRLETSDPAGAETGVLTELERIRRFGVTREELARAKAMIAGSRYRRLESLEGLADELAIEEARGDWKRLDSYLEGIRGVTASEVRRIVETYLTGENLATFEYLPESASAARSDAAFSQRVLGGVPENMVRRVVEEQPVLAGIPASSAELALDMVSPPLRTPILRGPDVYIVEDHRLPLVSFGIFYPGGRLYESADNAGITELMLRSALRGTRRYTSAEISRHLENSGARIEVVNEPDFFGYVLEGITAANETVEGAGQGRPLQHALGILMEVIQEPNFLEADVEQERRFQEARLGRFAEDNLRYPIQFFMRTLFDGHSYARPALGTGESLAALRAEDVAEWHRAHERFLVPVIVIVGDVNGTGPLRSIAATLTNEDLEERDILELPRPEIDAGVREAVETVRKRQSALVWGGPGPSAADPDRFALTVLENVLSGLGGRLFDAIREEQGLAYSVRVFDAVMARSGAFFAYTAFSPENEEAVRTALTGEIARLLEDGITDEELEQAVNYSIAVHDMDLETRRGRTLEIARNVIGGSGLAGVTEYSQSVRQVGAEDVHAAAREYLDPSRMTVAVVRGR